MYTSCGHILNVHNQLLLQVLINVLQTLQTYCGLIENMHFCDGARINFDEITALKTLSFWRLFAL